MAFKTADFDSTILPYKIVYDSDLSTAGGSTATAREDVTNGESGKIHHIEMTNASGNPLVYKFTLTEATVTVGTTVAQMHFTVPATTTVRYTIPEGVDFTTLSMWAVTAAAANATTPAATASSIYLITT
jgi:hypothetical protein